ncbi:MAG: phosphoribosylaminoimidazolesuccinocarboxamide synthase [Geodermatophilaceae bacterium]
MRLFASGKVRELYEMDDQRLLMVASDRISAYDVVLPTLIPDKGSVLTALSAWWFQQLVSARPHHLISAGDGVPAEIRGRGLLVRRLSMLPVECVARGYLAGSAVTEYAETGAVCGVRLPAGLRDGDRLPEPIFTPATKAAVGEHDENVSFDQVVAAVGGEPAERVRERTLAIYVEAAALAERSGILLADTKFEFGLLDEEVCLGDEVLTPDSSRLWPADEWRPGAAQPSYDKQFVRDWLTHESGWNRIAPGPELPAAIVAATRERYVQAYEKLTGLSFAAWPPPP